MGGQAIHARERPYLLEQKRGLWPQFDRAGVSVACIDFASSKVTYVRHPTRSWIQPFSRPTISQHVSIWLAFKLAWLSRRSRTSRVQAGRLFPATSVNGRS